MKSSDETPATAKKDTPEGQLSLTESLNEIEARANAATPGKSSFMVVRNDVPRLLKVVRWAIARIDTYEDGTAVGARMHVAQLLREPEKEQTQNLEET